jgi:hypothetical protein
VSKITSQRCIDSLPARSKAASMISPSPASRSTPLADGPSCPRSGPTRKRNPVSESSTLQVTPTTERRSRKLTVVVLLLAVLPLVLPPLLTGFVTLWLTPIIGAQIQACASLDCPPAVDLDRLGSLLTLGPSLLVAVASLLLGSIGWVRSHRLPLSRANQSLFVVSVACGVVWAAIFGCLLWGELAIVAPTVTD